MADSDTYDGAAPQPGFSPAHALRHTGRIKALHYAGRGQLVALTSSAVTTWATLQQGVEAPSPIKTAQLQLPSADFVAAIAPCVRSNLLIGSCLDASLRVWSFDRLTQRSCCPLDMGAGVPLHLLYNGRCVRASASVRVAGGARGHAPPAVPSQPSAASASGTRSTGPAGLQPVFQRSKSHPPSHKPTEQMTSSLPAPAA